ncbi:5'-methylthioadenosine/S-adenosylhomocysteine nucleosidase family protein [Ferruginibacter sp.]
MPKPSFKVRRLSMANSNDENLLRKINVYSTEREKSAPTFNTNDKTILSFRGKVRPNPDANYLKFYKQHNVWLSKVIKEIEVGKKVAFGAFRNYTHPTGDLFSGSIAPEECLIGSVIIKKGHSGQIELKNLLTDHYEIRKCFGEELTTTEQLRAYKNNIRQKLIDRCENFCSFRNYRRIEMEIHSANYELINLFLKNEYRIIHTRRSKYNDSDYFYIFSKNLSNFQGNDPYDYQFLVKNILTFYFPFQEIKMPLQSSVLGDDSGTLHYVLKSSNDSDTLALNSILDMEERNIDLPAETSTSPVLDESEVAELKKLDLTVECKVDFDLAREGNSDNDVIIINDQFLQKYDSSSNLKILFTDKKVFKENESLDEGSKAIKVLEWKDFEKLENVKKLYLNKLLRKSEIGGFLLVVEERFKERIVEFSKKDDVYTICMFDGCGNYLQNADNVDYHKNVKIFFYSHSSDKNVKEGIWGYASLERYSGGAKNFFDDEDEENYTQQVDISKSIYDDADLNYFSFYNDEKNKNVIKLHIRNIRLFDTIMPLEPKILSQKMIEYVYYREGGGDQWFDTFWFNSYFDRTTVENILKYDHNSQPIANTLTNNLEKLVTSQTQESDNLIKVVILTAIIEEYLAVKEHLTAIKDATKNDTSYEEGIFQYNGKRIAKVIIRECGQGNATAAAETERAIQNFHPQCMFFVGIAGSRKSNDFNVGDVVFPEKIYYYEGGKSKLESFSARPDVTNLSFTFKELAKRERRKSDWKDLIKGHETLKKSIKADLGVIASGEKIVEHHLSEVGKILSEHYEDTSAVEKEGFGFAKVITTFQGRNTGHIFVGVVRGISDIINFESNDANLSIDKRPKGNKQVASATASAFAFWLILKFVETPVQ